MHKFTDKYHKIKTINQLLLHCDQYKEKNAVICDQTCYSYEKFTNCINELTDLLLQHNLTKNGKVLITISGKLEFLVSIFAVIKAGGISVPISTRINSKDFTYVLNNSKPEIIICDNAFYKSKLWTNNKNLKSAKTIILLNKLNNYSKKINYKVISLKNKSTTILKLNKIKILPNDAALILYTSGTTAEKKGVLLSHKNLVETAKYMNKFMKINNTINEYVAVSLTHAFGFGRIRAILLSGGTIVLENGKLIPKKFMQSIKKHRCNSISSISTIFVNIMENEKKNLKEIGQQIKWIEIGSMPLKVYYRKKMLEVFPDARIHMNYGMTEAMRTTLIEFRTEFKKINSVGKPFSGIQIRIVDNHNNKLSYGKIGEICIKGKNVALGYWKKDNEWHKSFKDGWFKTNDIGFLDKDGYLTFVGRKDEMINVGGQKFYPTEIEQRLASMFKKSNYCVFGIPDHEYNLGELPVICIEGNTNHTINQIQKFLKGSIEEYKIPKFIVNLDKIPTTINGKVIRHKIKEKILKEGLL